MIQKLNVTTIQSNVGERALGNNIEIWLKSNGNLS